MVSKAAQMNNKCLLFSFIECVLHPIHESFSVCPQFTLTLFRVAKMWLFEFSVAGYIGQKSQEKLSTCSV